MADRTPRVRIVVLNFNGGPTTARCLEHLLALEWPAEALEVVCVDNASTDGSAELVAERFPQVEVRVNPTNTGFPANNLALHDLDHVDFVGLVNNDAFVEPGWLRPLVETLEADIGLGAACSKLVLEPRFAAVAVRTEASVPGVLDRRRLGVRVGRVWLDGVDVSATCHLDAGGWGPEVDGSGNRWEWTRGAAELRVPATDGGTSVAVELSADAPKPVTLSTAAGTATTEVGPVPTVVEVALDDVRFDVVNNVGSVVHPDGYGADRGWLERDRGQYDEPADVFAWCGGSVLLRPEYLADVGLFDERFFLYYEDTDLSWRGQARGWRYRTAPTSVARHVHAATSVEGSSLKDVTSERNRLLMLVKDAPAPLAAGQVLAFARATASYAARDVVAPVLDGQRPDGAVVGRRLRALAGVARLSGAALAERRRLRRSALVPDAVLLERLTPR